MINTLEEMYQEIKYEELVELYEKCLSKNKEEIIQIFKEKGYEISDDLALDYLKCYEKVTPIDDLDLSNVAGGNDDNGCLSGSVRIELEIAIKILEDSKSTLNPRRLERVQMIIDELNDLLTNSYNRVQIEQKFAQIEMLFATLYHDTHFNDNTAITEALQHVLAAHKANRGF